MKTHVSKNYCFHDGKWENKPAKKYHRQVCIQCDKISYSCDEWEDPKVFICGPGCYHGAHLHAYANMRIDSLRHWNQWSKDHDDN